MENCNKKNCIRYSKTYEYNCNIGTELKKECMETGEFFWNEIPCEQINCDWFSPSVEYSCGGFYYKDCLQNERDYKRYESEGLSRVV